MKTLIKCSRCAGSGRYSFNLVRGTVCFRCNGVGSVLVDPVAHAKTKAKSAARKAAASADMDARIAAGNALSDARAARYADDARIGPAWFARCAEFEAVAHETYKFLEDADSGKYIHGLPAHFSR